jgi:hypothetical protein
MYQHRECCQLIPPPHLDPSCFDPESKEAVARGVTIYVKTLKAGGGIFSLTSSSVHCMKSSPRARILKHLLEAEKSTFRGELSFQRSTVAKILCVLYYFKDFSVFTV